MNCRNRARVIIGDHHTLVAEGCKNLLEPEFDVVAVVPNGRTLLEVADEIRPDVVILELSMPGLSGLEAGELIKLKSRSIKLVYLTMSLEPEVAAEAFRRGASGFVTKHGSAEELATAVRCALRGESYLTPLITRDTVDYLLRSGAVYEQEKRISKRQREILQLLVEGQSMKQIASALKLKTGTVAFHKYRLMEALRITTSAGLIEYAIKQKMISAQ